MEPGTTQKIIDIAMIEAVWMFILSTYLYFAFKDKDDD